jgi:hypothetical protein
LAIDRLPAFGEGAVSPSQGLLERLPVHSSRPAPESRPMIAPIASAWLGVPPGVPRAAFLFAAGIVSSSRWNNGGG